MARLSCTFILGLIVILVIFDFDFKSLLLVIFPNIECRHLCCSKWAELANRSRKFSAHFVSRFLILRELVRAARIAARRNKSVRRVSDVSDDVITKTVRGFIW